MAVMVALLRGINVGGHNCVSMSALLEVFGELGFEEPVSFIQSGNVVFGTRIRDATRVAASIEESLEQSFGFRPRVMVRTFAELRSILEHNPFAARADIDPAKLLVTFLERPPDAIRSKQLPAAYSDGEELFLVGRELFVYYPHGAGKSKLATSIEKLLGTSGTARNWNTVCSLLKLAEAHGRES